VELLVVIAVIGILVSIMLPAINAVRDNARRLQCTNNLRQVGLAMLTYHGNHKRLPIGVQLRKEVSGQGFKGEIGEWKYPGTTAFALILPFVEERRAYDLYDFRKGFYDAANRDAVRTSPAIYRCPSDLPSPRRATMAGNYENIVVARSNYVVCFGDDLLFESETNPDTRGAFRADGARKIDDFRDGATKTVLASEVRSGLRDGEGGSTNADSRGVWAMELAGSAIYTHRLEPNSLEGDLINAWGATSSYCKAEPGMPCKASRVHGYYRDYAGARSNHAGGVNVVFADGHMLFVNEGIDLEVWRAVSTIDNSKFEVEVDINE
jgi:prepilin-type processing-associated H-X9-DG protein